MSRRIRPRSVDRWLSGKTSTASLVGLSDDSCDELLFLARARFERGEIEDAARIYDLALAFWPESADALLGAGACRQLVGDFHGAIGFYDRAILLREGDGYALANRAECLIFLGRAGEAMASIASIVSTRSSLQARIEELKRCATEHLEIAPGG